jgi:Zn-finger nucleic acid-binding protein
MLCPKDNVVCNTEQLQDVEVDVCPKCHGVWLDYGEVRKLVHHFSIPRYSNVDELINQWEVVESSSTHPKDFWIEDRLTCPNEGTKMKKHYFAGSLIGVDQCQKCKGFWLDGGELQAVAKYFEPNPELDKAWQLVIKDEKEWNRMLVDMKRLPTKIALMISKPVYGLTAIGQFIVQSIIDELDSSK